VSFEALNICAVDLDLATHHDKTSGGTLVRWFHFYGLERNDPTNDRYKIHHRQNVN
jgi:hypothetical protein